MATRTWTIDELRAAGSTIAFETAAEVLGISKSHAYELARNDEFPVRRIRLGRRVVVSVPDLLKFLGAD